MPPAGTWASGLSTSMDHGQEDARHRSEQFMLYPENGAATQSQTPSTAGSSPRYHLGPQRNNSHPGYGNAIII